MNDLKTIYTERYFRALVPLAKSIESELQDTLRDFPRIDRVGARAKSVDRFLQKAAKVENGILKYTDPIKQIQDQVGARIITFYLNDVITVSDYIRKYYSPIEIKQHIPDSEKEFGYFGKHFIFLIPDELKPSKVPSSLIPNFFELQVVTLFQHAWSEAEHDISYKPTCKLNNAQLRKIAFTAAQAWGADMIFEELHNEILSN
jgi:ppGpp synthetase/RelA/SpoT-type nucleotidyltranferase